MLFLALAGAALLQPAALPREAAALGRLYHHARAPRARAPRPALLLEEAERVAPISVSAPARSLARPPGSLGALGALRALWRCTSFHDFMQRVREAQGDVVRINLQPVLPPTYLMFGKAANRRVLGDFDASLEQVLQELINVLPVSARIPSEVDHALQRNVAALFQNETHVATLLPSFVPASLSAAT